MSAPSEPAWHYDGASAVRRAVLVAPEDGGFRLIEGDVTGPTIAWRDLQPLGDARDVGLKGRPGWRLAFDQPPGPAIAAHLPSPSRYGGVIDRWGLWPATIAFAAMAAVAVLIVLHTPALLARLVPVAVEQRIGDVMVGDFGRRGCSTPAGDAALDALVQRLDPYDPSISVHVVRLPIVNAVTLPGGRVVLFDGLVQKARSPDEVAGVVGHEIGHAHHRDVMEALLRQLGLSVLLGGLEGHVGGGVNALLAASYSRDAEARADAFSMTLMQQARISPAPTATFFDRLQRMQGRDERSFAYLSSHPVSSDRARRFRQSATDGQTYRPALDQAQWQALRGICAGQPDELRWGF